MTRGEGEPVGIVAAGAVTALGLGWKGLSDAVRRGAVRFAPLDGAAAFGGVLAACVPDLPGDVVGCPPKQVKLMSRSARLASAAMRAVLEDAGWDEGHRRAAACYLGVGGAAGLVEDLEAVARACIVDGRLSMEHLATLGLRAVNPLGTFRLMNNFTLCHGAIARGLGGPNAALFSRGAGTVMALEEATHAVRSGAAARALAGGADSPLHPLALAQMHQDGRLASTLPLGEGAAILALAREGPFLARIEVSLAPRMRADAVAMLHADARVEADLIVLSPATLPARVALEELCARRFPGVALLDASGLIGNGLAATPALAWVTALDEVVAARARRVAVITLDGDDRLGVVMVHEVTASPARTRAPSSVSAGPASSTVPVITGVGVVSGFGVGTEALFDGLASGRTAVRPIRSFDASHSPVRMAAEVPGDPTDPHWLSGVMASSSLREAWGRAGVLRDRKVPFALQAAMQAWTAAGCTDREAEAWLTLGLGLERVWFDDFVELFDGGGFDWLRSRAAGRGARLRSSVDAAAAAVGELLALTGPVAVNASACAAGALAVAHAASLIARGEAEVVVTGGADSMIDPMAIGGFWNLGALSPRAESDACRPFDSSRDGLVVGEGAAVFVVESERRALARGARPLARLLGWGSTQDAHRVTAPQPAGTSASGAMKAAMAMAGVSASDVGWVNAHGTGTPLNDVAEARAIRLALGAEAERVPVSSIKGAVGHLMAGAGAIELASCLMPFSRGLLPGTPNLRSRDPECALNVLGPEPVRASVDVVLSNSFGFGGQNACLILGRF